MRPVLAALTLAVFASPLMAAPTPDAGASKIYNAAPGGTAITAPYTVTAGSNQVLMVVIECETCSAPTSVKYNSLSLTSALAETNAGLNVWTYYLTNPPAGSSLSVAVTLGASYFSPMAVFAFSYSGVNQSNAIGNVGGSMSTPTMSGGVNNVTLGFTPSQATSTVVELSNEHQPGGAALTLDHGAVRFTSNNVNGNSPSDFSYGDWNPASLAAQTFKYTWTKAGTTTGTITMLGAIELLASAPATTFTSTATPTPSVTVTSTYTNTPVPTPTPKMALTKTSSVSTATIGDTITFCFNWSNDSSGTVTMDIWDTVSSFLTYQNCNTGCTHVGSLVRWSFSSVAGSNGTVCFWGTVNGYPYMPELLAPPSIEARRKDLDFLVGLLPEGGDKL